MLLYVVVSTINHNDIGDNWSYVHQLSYPKWGPHFVGIYTMGLDHWLASNSGDLVNLVGSDGDIDIYPRVN